MNPLWTLGQSQIAQAVAFQLEQVLIEFNGPHMALASVSGVLNLGVAADADDAWVRWIFAPVSSVELRALASGASTAYSALAKPNAIALDCPHDGADDFEFVRAFDVDASQLDRVFLPEPSAHLPIGARNLILERFQAHTSPQLALARVDQRPAPLSFKVLSAVLSSYQKLCSAIAQSLEGDSTTSKGRWSADLEERSTIGFNTAKSGSLLIGMKPEDGALYERISETLAELASWGESTSPMGYRPNERVLARFADLLKVVDRSGIDVLNQSAAGNSAFLSPAVAKRLIAKLSPKATAITKSSRRGSFNAFSASDYKFEFLDEELGEALKGDVDASAIPTDEDVSVGQTNYSIFLETEVRTSLDGKVEEKHRLKALLRTDPSVDVKWLLQDGDEDAAP